MCVGMGLSNLIFELTDRNRACELVRLEWELLGIHVRSVCRKAAMAHEDECRWWCRDVKSASEDDAEAWGVIVAVMAQRARQEPLW